MYFEKDNLCRHCGWPVGEPITKRPNKMRDRWVSYYYCSSCGATEPYGYGETEADAKAAAANVLLRRARGELTSQERETVIYELHKLGEDAQDRYEAAKEGSREYSYHEGYIKAIDTAIKLISNTDERCKKSDEPAMWIIDRTEIVCPACHTRFNDNLEMLMTGEYYYPKHCPECGKKMRIADKG